MLLFKSWFRVQGVGFRKGLSLIPYYGLCFLILLIISSCGFTPVYSKQGDNAEIAAKLSSVEVKPIKTLIGQEYVNALQDVLDPGRVGAVKDYEMEVTITKAVSPLAIERDRTVTRYKVAVTANYKLKASADGKIISSGTLKGESDYDKVDSYYATYVSDDDTTRRVIRELAQDTKIRIISALLK